MREIERQVRQELSDMKRFSNKVKQIEDDFLYLEEEFSEHMI